MLEPSPRPRHEQEEDECKDCSDNSAEKDAHSWNSWTLGEKKRAAVAVPCDRRRRPRTRKGEKLAAPDEPGELFAVKAAAGDR
jgi:hypothetical protein